MNEELSSASRPARETDDASRVAADNYERYLDDAYGYAYGARDILPMEELEAHDRLLDDPEGSLRAPGLDDRGDFELLGLARGCVAQGELDRFENVYKRLLESDGDHDGVRYPELPLLAGRVGLRHGALDRAEQWLEQGLDRWSDCAREAGLLRARIALRRGETDRADEMYRTLVHREPDDPELPFEIAEDLAAEGYDGEASRWVERARETAERVGDQAIGVDLEILESRLDVPASGADVTGE